LVAPLVAAWKKVVASRTSTGTEIVGSTNAFLISLHSPLTPFPLCKPAISSLIISFCLAKFSCLLGYVLTINFRSDGGNIKVGPRSNLQNSTESLWTAQQEPDVKLVARR